MILSFDVDCGELVQGHHFVARGLAGPYALPIPDDWDGEDVDYDRMLPFADAGYPGFSLEYELVPGVVASDDVGSFFRYLVAIAYDADVNLPWQPTDGGAIAPFQGGPATHGSRGDWPLPPNAAVLTFTLYAVGADGFGREDSVGELVVDLARSRASWHPA